MDEQKECQGYVMDHTAKIAKIEQNQDHLADKIDELKTDIKQLIKIVQEKNETGAGFEQRLSAVESSIETAKSILTKIFLAVGGFTAVFVFTWIITHVK